MTQHRKKPLKNKPFPRKKAKELHQEYFASCAMGLEEVLQKELTQIGIKKTKKTKGGVHFTANADFLFLALLNSRIASRIYKKLYEFQIFNEESLYQQVFHIPWDEHLQITQYFKIKVIQSSSPRQRKRSKFKNSLFLTYKIKDAIVDHFSKKYDKRPSIDIIEPDFSLLAHIEPEDKPYSDKENVTLLLDLAGSPLHRRGYRFRHFPAPVKENLAAGLLALTGWDCQEPLVDLMCGSGTFLTEALLIASQTSVSFQKYSKENWDFHQHQWFIRKPSHLETWNRLINQKTAKTSPSLVYGNDISKEAISTTKAHLEAIGFSHKAKLSELDALKVMPPTEQAGIVILNPPYGERLSEIEELKPLYKELGDHYKQHWKGWRVFMLIGNPELIKCVGLRSSRKHIIFNGPIECRFVEYQLY